MNPLTAPRSAQPVKKPSHSAGQICMLLAALPPEVLARVAASLGPDDLATIESVAQALAAQPAWKRKRLMLEALSNPRLAAILAQYEVERINRELPLPPPGPRPSLRDSLLEMLDPRVWFRFRRNGC